MLREVDVKMVKNDVCVQKYIYMNPEIQLCAGINDGLSNVCKGDSGGGLFCKNANSRWYLLIKLFIKISFI
jgi:secreted trypsin-like serine protease